MEAVMNRALFVLQLFFLLLAPLLVPQPACATMDWLKAGQEMLGTLGQSKTGQQSTAATALTEGDVVSGLKDALRVGSETVVSQLGSTDGFNADPVVHIPLPENLKKVKSALSAVGMGALMDDLELKLNRAAEEATPPARELFMNAIDEMTVDDAMGIYKGPDDAATRYFQGKMSEPLAKAMQPIVERALNQVGALQAYDAVMGKYATLPFVPDVKANLNQHVVDGGMNGIFHYLAEQEAEIRHNPVKRTTEILQKVFGAQ
jgi:hypothetical protein